MTLRPAFLAALLLILAAPLAAAEAVPVPVDVPFGSGIPVITDGTFSPGEWEDALRIPLNGQVSLHVKTHGGVVFIGIRGHEPFTVGPSELFVAPPGGPTTRFHVSAQLYEAAVPAEGNAPAPRFGWTPGWYASEIRFDEPLSKKLMSEGKSPMEMIRGSHYPTDGLEFAIRREKFPGDRWLMRLGVTAFVDGKPGAFAWPAGTAESTTDGWAELRLPGGASAAAPDWQREPSGTTSTLIGIGSWNGGMLAVGQNGALLRRAGGSWSPLPPPAQASFTSFWAASPRELFLAGDEGALFHFDGSAWTRIDSGTKANLDAIWGSSRRDVFAVGDADGTIVHFDGDRWTRMESGTAEPLFAICGTSPRDVFAVGMNGTALHFDGSAWKPFPTGTVAALTGVWCGSPTNVYAVGTGGTILHYDGRSWRGMASGVTTHLMRVWGRSADDVFAVGRGGVVLRNRGSGWYPLASGTTESLIGIGGDRESVIAVGRSGTILRLKQTAVRTSRLEDA